GIALLSGLRINRKSAALATAATVRNMKNLECGQTVQYLPITVNFPPIEMLRNHAPMRMPRMRCGATFETSERPMGLTSTSAMETKKQETISHHVETLTVSQPSLAQT